MQAILSLLLSVILAVPSLGYGNAVMFGNHPAWLDFGGAEEETNTADTLNVIFTVDTEDKRGSDPSLIEGDLSGYGIEENCGVDYIMDTFEAYGERAVFFVNIYEHVLYDDDYMPSLLQRMNSRGHEVELHTHMAQGVHLDYYNKNLDVSTAEEQRVVYSYGRDYIYDAIGRYPIAYRAGAYRINDDTFGVLHDLGFLIDSSVYFGMAENNLVEYQGISNQLMEIDGVLEFPIVVVNRGGALRKMDIDSLDTRTMIRSLEKCRESRAYNTVQIMFHSFTFMDTSVDDGQEPLYMDGDKPVCGENAETKQRLTDLLDYLTTTEGYNIITFEEYLKMNLPLPEYESYNLVTLSKNYLVSCADEWEKRRGQTCFEGLS